MKTNQMKTGVDQCPEPPWTSNTLPTINNIQLTIQVIKRKKPYV
jgi:hypothetical protein